jgi:hypothetical protein
LTTFSSVPLGDVIQPPIPWIDRPTQQQAVDVQGTSPRQREPSGDRSSAIVGAVSDAD